VPFKTCHWNCVYCQLGRTAPLRPERRSYAPVDDVVREVGAALARAAGAIDWVTFGGSGEPTLHVQLGHMIRRVKALRTPVAVLTSGALLHLPEVREDLLPADAVLPSLDAGSEPVYRAVNRPWPGLAFSKLVEGLLAFRAAYRGRLWVEVMLVRGVNDGPRALADIASVLKRIGPDGVFVNVATRPAAESWVVPPDPEAVQKAAALLGATAPSGSAPPPSPVLDVPESLDAFVAVLSRHPLDEEELRERLACWPGGAETALAAVRRSHRVQRVHRGGKTFWGPAAGRYG
jgi:wyosine [tRNA(Phe)-imidazoG37] synthetase (radical SAM superfamily)